MSIDNFTDEGIRVQELTLTDPTERIVAPFNPYRDVPQTKWKQLEEKAEIYADDMLRTADDSFSLGDAWIFQTLNIFFQGKTKELFGGHGWALLLAAAQKAKGLNKLPEAAVAMKLFNPGTEVLTPDEWKDEIDSLHANMETTDKSIANTTITTLSNLTIIDPEKTKHIRPPQKIWDLAKEEVKAFKESDLIIPLTHFLASIKIIAPEKLNEVGLDENLWKRIKSSFDNVSDNGLSATSLKLLTSMSILGASEVKISKSGMHLNFDPKQSISGNNPPQPEVRRF